MQNNIVLKSLQPIMILRFISTVTYGVFYSSLSLLLIQTFNLTNQTAASITALFFAFHYALPILGGGLTSHFNNFKQIFITGKIFQLFSTFVLIHSIYDNQYMFLGLGLFLVDSMVNVVSLNMLITNKFDKSHADARGLAFLKGHIWSNYGFVTAFLLSGGIYYFVGIKYLFYICAVFSLITILYCTFYIKNNQKIDSYLFVKRQINIILFMLLTAVIVTIFLTNHYLSREIILLSASITIIGIFGWTIINLKNNEKIAIITFFLFMMCSIAFWSIYMLGPTFLPIFIDGGVDTMLFGITIPPQWFQILCPLTTVTVGIMLSQKISKMIKRNESTVKRSHLFILGLICTILALLILYYIIKMHSLGIHSNCVLLMAYIMILAIGEILLAPASMALIGDYIPENYQGIYTGVNQMSIGLSVILSGVVLQNLLLPAYELKNNSINYSSNFIYLAAIVSCIVIMLFVFDKRFKNRVA